MMTDLYPMRPDAFAIGWRDGYVENQGDAAR